MIPSWVLPKKDWFSGENHPLYRITGYYDMYDFVLPEVLLEVNAELSLIRAGIDWRRTIAMAIYMRGRNRE